MKTKVLVVLLLGAGTLFAETHVSIGIGIGVGGYRYAPPPAVRYMPLRPGPDYVWVEGYWYPVGHGYRWREGYWNRRPYRAERWVGPRGFRDRDYRDRRYKDYDRRDNNRFDRDRRDYNRRDRGQGRDWRR